MPMRGCRHAAQRALTKRWWTERLIAWKASSGCATIRRSRDEVISQPVFLTGLPRSGTTFFQYLFDRDTRFRLIRTWEGISPSPPPGYDAESVRRRKAEEGERRRQTRPPIPGFEALHLIDADGPEECHAFMEHSYAAAGLYNLFNVPSYFDYLMTSLDLTAAYRIHRRQLQLLQWRMPQPRWALKYPNHVIAMDSILEVHPDARFVMTHRDPVQTLASIAKMSFTLRGVRYDTPIDPKVVGRQMLDFVQRHIDRIMAFCQFAASRSRHPRRLLPPRRQPSGSDVGSAHRPPHRHTISGARSRRRLASPQSERTRAARIPMLWKHSA